MLVIPGLRTQKQVGTWGFLASHLAYLVNFRSMMMLSKKKTRWMAPEEQQFRASSLHMHSTHTYTQHHTYIHPPIEHIKGNPLWFKRKYIHQDSGFGSHHTILYIMNHIRSDNTANIYGSTVDRASCKSCTIKTSFSKMTG